jgi:hypothetical protein
MFHLLAKTKPGGNSGNYVAEININVLRGALIKAMQMYKDKTFTLHYFKEIDYNYSQQKGSALLLYELLNTNDQRYKQWGPNAFNQQVVVRFVIAYTYDWEKLFFMPSFMKKFNILEDSDTATLAVSKNSAVYQYLSDNLKYDNHIIDLAFKAKYRNFFVITRNFRKIVVLETNLYNTNNPEILRQIPGEFQNNFAEYAVRLNGLALKYVHNKTDILTEYAVYNDYNAFKFGTDKQKNNPKFRDYVFEQSLKQDSDLLTNSWFTELCKENELKQYRAKLEQSQKEEKNSWHNNNN